VAGHGAASHLSGALGNRRHIGDLAPSIRPPRPRPTRLARLTQCGQQCAPQGAAGQHSQRRIDGQAESCLPMSSGHARWRRPAICSGEQPWGQMCLDILPQPGVEEYARSPRLTGPSCRQRLRRAGSIGSSPAS
jgi:hypothetical protein